MSGELLALLKDGDLSKSGILEHICELIRGSVENKSQLKGLNNIEIFSYYLRKNKFLFKEHWMAPQLAFFVNQQKQYHPYVTAVEETRKKINKIDDHRAHLRPDLMQEYQALKIAGVSIGQTNAYHLKEVIKGLAIDHQTKSIRFWGKILGYKDYWVVQGTSNKVYLDQLPANGEKYGTGVNTYSYWVATDILGTWYELPLVTPEQVASSGRFKYVFTGNPETQIKVGSFFVGQEKDLLKCIVSRITHSCQLAPKGLYKPGEENPNIIEFEDEFKLPEVAELNSLDSWVHLNPNILNQGRCSHYIDPKLSQEQRETLTAELAQKDPIVERLKGIAEDKPYQALGFTANWTASIAGETVPVSQIGKQEGTNLVYGVACLRNLVWPGVVTVGYRGGWTNIYVGYGHRLSQEYNLIRQLKETQAEAQERTQFSEPNPSKPPAPAEQKKQQQVPAAEEQD